MDGRNTKKEREKRNMTGRRDKGKKIRRNVEKQRKERKIKEGREGTEGRNIEARKDGKRRKEGTTEGNKI